MNRPPPPAPILAVLTLSALGLPGCATVAMRGDSLVPTRHVTPTGPYRIYTNFALPADAPAVRHLQSLEQQIEASLGVRVDPGESPIEVYILDDRKAFTHFLTYYYPELPPRRAFFFAQGSKRVVYTYLGERLEEDLRHEATHALMHAAFLEMPLWLDEGLAEYFEGGDSRSGLNPEHLHRLPEDVASGWSPDLRNLEGLRDVRQMTPRDYRESWAWVHYLLNTAPSNKAALLAYLSELRGGYAPEPLSARLEASGTAPAPGPMMLAHINQLQDRPVATAAGPARPSTVRLQNAPPTAKPEPYDPPERRRGFFGRIIDAVLGRDRRKAGGFGS